MIPLNNAQNGIRNNNRPQIITVNPINHKENTSDEIYDPDLLDVFQHKTQYNEERSGVADIVGNFRTHS